MPGGVRLLRIAKHSGCIASWERHGRRLGRTNVIFKRHLEKDCRRAKPSDAGEATPPASRGASAKSPARMNTGADELLTSPAIAGSLHANARPAPPHPRSRRGAG